MAVDLAPILTGVLSAAASALTDAQRPAGLVHLAPGSIVAWDNCCEGSGQLWLRVIDMGPSAGPGASFPAYDGQQRGDCFPLLSVQIGLGVVRCAHTVDDYGTPPTGPEMSADAIKALDDMSILLDVLMGTVRTLSGVQAVKLGRWLPQGPEGGCAGGEWTAYLGVWPCLGTPLPGTEPEG